MLSSRTFGWSLLLLLASEMESLLKEVPELGKSYWEPCEVD